MTPKHRVKKTLGSVSAAFLFDLQRKGVSIFTLDDAVKVYGKDRIQTAKFISSLIKREILVRLKAQIYMISLPGQESAQLTNWPIIARELAKNNSYSLSYYSAMRLHGMTTHALFSVYITTTKRMNSRKINNITYHFIHSIQKNFWGYKDFWVTKHDKVLISDLEKTILDALDRSELCGGIEEISRGIWMKQKDIDWNKLIKYAKKFNNKAAVKRLGFIVEALGLSVNYQALQKIIAPKKDYIFLDSRGPKQGKYIGKWHICLNINIEELQASVWA